MGKQNTPQRQFAEQQGYPARAVHRPDLLYKLPPFDAPMSQI